MRCFKLIRAAHGQRDNTCSLELGSSCKKLIHRCGRSQAVVGQHLHVEPQHIRAVNVHRYGIDFTVIGDLVQQQLGHILVEALLLEEGGQRLQLARINILRQLFAGVHLPRVRWLAALQPRLQNSLGICACSAGNGGVHNFNAGILGCEDLEHLVQAIGFAAVGPPAEDFHLLDFGRRGRCCRRWRLGCGGGTRAQQNCSYCQR